MADIGENIRAVIVASTGINALVSGRVHQSVVPEDTEVPRIWYTRAGSIVEKDNAGVGNLADSSWDIECHANALDNAQDLAAAVKALLDGKRGAFGSTTLTEYIQGAFVEDHDDDYIPKGIGESDDEHIHVASLSVQIWH